MSEKIRVEGLEFDALELPEEALIAGGMLMAKVIEADGSVSIRLRHSGLSWLERLGMVRAVQIIEAEELIAAFHHED